MFLVRIPKIYISGIQIRTNQECFGDQVDQPNRARFSHRDVRVYHIFLKMIVCAVPRLILVVNNKRAYS